MPSPLTHISGIVHALLVPAVFGASAVLMDRWEPAAARALIAAERVTYLVGAPTFLRDLAAGAPGETTSLRLFSCGGADVDPALVREAAARLGCVAKRVYGSTEFPTVTTTGPDDPTERRIDSEGRAIGANEVGLFDEDGAAVAPGREGEILARGPECFLGYRNPALNADAFTADGWFRTGDLGTLDAEGYLRITGRRKDIIIRKGENISARELEDLLAAHPAVAEVAVVGVPDAVAGEIACAVLRLPPGARPPTLAEVAEHLTARGLSRRKLPARLQAAAALPCLRLPRRRPRRARLRRARDRRDGRAPRPPGRAGQQRGHLQAQAVLPHVRRRGGAGDARQLPLLRVDHDGRHPSHAPPGRGHDRQHLLLRLQGLPAPRGDVRRLQGRHERLQRGPVERPRRLEHPRGAREPGADRHRDLAQGGRAGLVRRQEVPARDRERRDLRGDREAPLRDDHPEAEPDAAHGALPAPLPALAPPLRHGEDGPRAAGGGREGAGALRPGEAARRSERDPVSRCGRLATPRRARSD